MELEFNTDTQRYEIYKESKLYKICNVLASMTAKNRFQLNEELRNLGEDKFIEKYV